jgi:putative restriction endonuclease
MKAYVGITDKDWFGFLASRPEVSEVNFWKPGGGQRFSALSPGELFLFKLHSPDDFIVGGGLFAHFSALPVSLAWETFDENNGARSLGEMRSRIQKYRRTAPGSDDYTIGCILLESPFFLPPEHWITVPTDWARSIQVGKVYDLGSGEGARLYRSVLEQLALHRAGLATELVKTERFGKPTTVLPRLGQASFRVVVTDAYGRRCAVTGERTLPVLDAAHIRPYALGGTHDPRNGLLLRTDLHRLFDKGYLTVTPNLTLQVSRKIREEFENGREYYALHGSPLRTPGIAALQPDRAQLQFHNENVYLG